jgi:hypothetical protein
MAVDDRLARRRSAGLIEVTPFFAVPFGFAKLENCTALNAELRELFMRRAAEGSRYANPRPLTQRQGRIHVFRKRRPQYKPLTAEFILRTADKAERYSSTVLRLRTELFPGASLFEDSDEPAATV